VCDLNYLGFFMETKNLKEHLTPSFQDRRPANQRQELISQEPLGLLLVVK
jgi:hypothetical protein